MRAACRPPRARASAGVRRACSDAWRTPSPWSRDKPERAGAELHYAIRRPGDLQARAPDHALGHGEDDLALVRRWFQHLQLHVQAVDFVGARSLFAEEIVTFGTVRAFTVGREATEREQWRNVWSRIDGFRWQLDDLRVIISGDRRTAVGMALFESVGYAADGTPYDRPG